MFQAYVEDICKDAETAAAEDSSYDSDYDGEECRGPGGGASVHQDVSRTVSDTLGAEFAEYVSQAQPPGYTARVEFALKLGNLNNL